ncbi:MAG TPA: enoyl-ACP reductase, partial [Leptospiraceae bacterium]|nr:enoyl-ACP reductase [Leptospiraceae bacterium]
MNLPLKGCTYLITGIIDSGSLALTAAKQIVAEGGEVICTGLGKTPFHQNLSEKAQGYLDSTYSAFQETVRKELGTDVLTFPLDVTIDESINSFSKLLAEKNIRTS